MIKIIKGVYGYMTKSGTVKPKTEKDEPFELTAEQEARLVSLGVAVYVEDAPAKVPDNEQMKDEATAHLDPEQLAELTNAKLKELAEEMGIDTKNLKTKAQLIEAITSVDVIPGHVEDVEDDGEELPDFDATEAVE